ncbi:MAG: hypothetical protein WC558_07970 [Patulibacter sp.]
MRRFLLLAAAVLTAAFTVSVSAASAGVLSVSLDGSGAGAVTSSPAGIDCSNVPGSTQTTCSHDYGFLFSAGTLTATPAEGSAFLAWSGTAGGTCTGATNPCVTGLLLFDMAATATFAPKPDAPATTTGTVSDVSFPSATVNGAVNPGSNDFPVSDCYFEFGLTTDYGERSACRPGSIGTGTSPVAVSASIGVLDPGKTYHYRLVATNGGGTARGDDQTFTSGEAPADDCPNAEVRAKQGALAQRLPNCGAYELVTPAFTGGQGASLSVGTADGERAMLYSVGGFADTENLPALGVHYATQRTASGWKTTAIAPPASVFPYIGQYSALDWTRDGSRSLWFVNLKADEGTRRFTPVVRDPDGSFHVAGPTQNDQTIPGASSEDLLTVVQRTATRLTVTDGTTDDRSSGLRSLYASTRGENGQLTTRQVAYRAGATMFPDCSAELGGVIGDLSLYGRNAVSQDGQRVFFTAAGAGQCEVPAVRRVWAKVGSSDPIDLSASQCELTCGAEETANFRGASRDGSRVYFATEQQLVPEDQDTSDRNDLYEYDFNASGQKLRLVTGSAEPEGAGVSAAGLFRVSDDGAYVYFVASGRPLAGPNDRGAAPQPGDSNLYVYRRADGQANGSTTFIGALASVEEQAAQMSATGRYFLFESAADLVGERVAGDAQKDAYLFDAQEDALRRVWTNDPAHNGSGRVDGATVGSGSSSVGGVPSAASSRVSTGGWNSGLQVSADGSLVGFTTREALSQDDRNDVTDAYLWEAVSGRLTMVTDGTTRVANRFIGSGFIGMTPSGDSLFVSSASPLLREHTSGQNAAYVIRRSGGFPEAAAPREPCEGDDCQPKIPTPPGPGGPAGSSTFGGPGNVLQGSSSSSASVRIGKVKSVRGSSTRISVRVSGKGKIQVSGANLARTSVAVGKAGSHRVSVKLSAQGRRTLQRKQRLKVRVSVRFTPAKGKSVISRVSVTFSVKTKARKAKASSRGTRELSVLTSDLQKGR